MKSTNGTTRYENIPLQRQRLAVALIPLLGGMLVANMATAAEIEGTGDMKMRWDNTFKYSTAYRLNDPDPYVANYNDAQPNTDFGDLSFGKGQINSRLDWLTELDVSYKNFGARVSASMWNDASYQKDGAFPAGPPNTQAALTGTPNNQFPTATKNLMAKNSEFNDAFVYGTFDLGDRSLSVRVGQHTQIYGETLFLGANGIAAAQGPVDLVKAFSQPNAQFKEVAMPINQISTTLTLAPNLSVGAYYQLQWKPLRVPAAGSYFSPADFVGEGADLLLTPFGGTGLATRGADYKGSDSGNFGLQAKFSAGDVDYGVYAVKYDDKAPIPVVNMASVAAGGGGFGGGVYNVMYAKNITAYGASFSTVLGGANVAGEISTRRNVALAAPGDLVINTAVANADNGDNTPYARGNSLHINLSTIVLFNESRLWGAASFVGELAFNRLLGVTYDPGQQPFSALSSTHTRDATAIRFVFQPEYFGVLPDVNLQVPIGVGYGVSGRSAVVSVLPEGGGDFSIGLNATIHGVWKAGLNFTHYFGESGTATSQSSVGPYASYKQYYADRDFVSLSIQRSF